MHCARPARRSAEKHFLHGIVKSQRENAKEIDMELDTKVYLDSVCAMLKDGSTSGDYILHRIVSVSSNGRFTILGDAQLMKSAENVSGKCIKAIVTSACRSGKHQTSSSFSWKAFSFILSHTARVRRFPTAIYSRIKSQKENVNAERK